MGRLCAGHKQNSVRQVCATASTSFDSAAFAAGLHNRFRRRRESRRNRARVVVGVELHMHVDDGVLLDRTRRANGGSSAPPVTRARHPAGAALVEWTTSACGHPGSTATGHAGGAGAAESRLRPGRPQAEPPANKRATSSGRCSPHLSALHPARWDAYSPLDDRLSHGTHRGWIARGRLRRRARDRRPAARRCCTCGCRRMVHARVGSPCGSRHRDRDAQRATAKSAAGKLLKREFRAPYWNDRLAAVAGA